MFLLIMTVIFYLVNRFIQVDSTIKMIINIFLIIIVIAWVLHYFGLLKPG
jgi:hypothetical protein